ncbi:MAG TPA: NUDIX hydrolase N-terminal domain-containing protein, partial [Steroidobacteraceae bacterium]
SFTHDRFDRERFEAIRAIAAEMIAAGADAPAERAREFEALFAAQAGYATPKVDVRAAVFRDDRILLVRERSDGRWTLPGGWADVGDSPAAAVEREALEESGFEVRAVKLAAVYDRNRHAHTPYVFHIWKLFFLCEIVGAAAGETSRVPAEPAPGSARAEAHTQASWSETDAVDFFPENALPPLSLGRVTALQIAHMFEHHRDRERPTGFD